MTEFSKFPKGNPRNAYSVIEFAIAGWKTFTGKDVTWPMIKTQWGQYLKSVGGRETKYIKAMENFVRDKDYENVFDLDNTAGINKLLDKYKNINEIDPV